MSTGQAENTQHYHDDEIDLIELIANLWREKLVIVATTVAIGLVGAIYTLTATPVYKVSIELSPPSIAELSYLNQTEFFSISPDNAFAEFIDVAESSKHLNELVRKQSELIQKATDIETNENIFNALDKTREIEYPNTTKKTNSLNPDKYVFSYTGTDRQELDTLTLADLTLASASTNDKIEEKYKNSLQLQITKMEREQTLQKKIIDDQINARKVLVLANRADKLKQLEEAFKIAQALDLSSPSSLSRLATGTGNRQVEITAELNNNQDPLYLRGTKLLGAEIKNLKELEDTVFLDAEVRSLENQKLLLENNRELEQLKGLISKVNANQEISFFNQNTNNPSSPIRPKKMLILVISILLGGMLGLFVAIGRIVYKNAKQQNG